MFSLFNWCWLRVVGGGWIFLGFQEGNKKKEEVGERMGKREMAGMGVDATPPQLNAVTCFSLSIVLLAARQFLRRDQCGVEEPGRFGREGVPLGDHGRWKVGRDKAEGWFLGRRGW